MGIRSYDYNRGRSKAIIHVPGWVEGLETADAISTTAEAYAYVPLIYRALRLRCDSLSSVPMLITRNGNEQEWPFPESPLDELIWKTEAALLLKGAAYWLKLSNTRRVRQLQWLNPFTMRVKYIGKREEGGAELQFEQSVGAESNTWTQDEIVYFREFDPSDDIGPGVSAVSVALNDAAVMRYISRFAGYFFEGGAMPVTLLSIEGVVQEDERRRVEGRFKQLMTGIKNSWRVIAMRQGVEPKTLTPPLKDLAMPELEAQARRNIAQAFGIPITMIDEAANYATAQEHRKSFWEDTIQPRGDLLASIINRQLLGPLGMELIFDFQAMDIFQEEETQRSGSLLNLTQAGVPPLTAMDILGYDLTDEQREILEKVPSRMEVVTQRITSDIAIDNKSDPYLDELGRWERVAVRRMKDGKPQKIFESDIIEPVLLSATQAQLETAESVDDVKAVFADLRNWREYP